MKSYRITLEVEAPNPGRANYLVAAITERLAGLQAPPRMIQVESTRDRMVRQAWESDCAAS